MSTDICVQQMICSCCGSTEFEQREVLWQGLIDAWELQEAEVKHIDRQQGLACTRCGANLRSIALAQAIMQAYGYQGVFTKFVKSWRARRLRVLEINEAGTLTRHLTMLPKHRLTTYPDIDMTKLPFDECSFDAVVHSDTLEHVPDPVTGLRECCRVLRVGGFCFFTVPIIVNRQTRTREGMSPSYHGSSKNPADCLVYTEYGADAWAQVIQSGFQECRIHAFEHPVAHTLIGVK